VQTCLTVASGQCQHCDGGLADCPTALCSFVGEKISTAHKLTPGSTRFWSMAGIASLEIDATLLTIRPLDECQVWSKYFGETKVSSRCIEVSDRRKKIARPLPVTAVASVEKMPH
jgi:hypothetical protein